MSRRSRAPSWILIGIWTYVTAFLAAVAAVSTFHGSLSESDGASGFSLFGFFMNPYYWGFGGLLSVAAATLALPAAIWSLQRTDLGRSIPCLSAMAIVCAAVMGPTSFFAAPAALVVGLLAMVCMRYSPVFQVRRA